MNIPKQGMLVGLAVATVGATGFVIADQANAQSGDSGHQSLISKIAKKFNVSETDVKDMFDANKTDMEAAHTAEATMRLQALVDNKTITVEQKTVIEAKIVELRTQRDAGKDTMKDLTSAERKVKHDAEKTALEAWAKDNSIDLTKIRGLFNHGHGGPMNGERMSDQ